MRLIIVIILIVLAFIPNHLYASDRVSEWNFNQDNWYGYIWSISWQDGQWIISISVPPSPPPDDPILGKDNNPCYPFYPSERCPILSTYPNITNNLKSANWDSYEGVWHYEYEKIEQQYISPIAFCVYSGLPSCLGGTWGDTEATLKEWNK